MCVASRTVPWVAPCVLALKASQSCLRCASPFHLYFLARNFATYANESGQHNDVREYIKRHRLG